MTQYMSTSYHANSKNCTGDGFVKYSKGVVFDEEMNALYMSRTPIPYPFKSIDYNYYKHVGIIGYNKKMLNFYKNSEPKI